MSPHPMSAIIRHLKADSPAHPIFRARAEQQRAERAFEADIGRALQESLRRKGVPVALAPLPADEPALLSHAEMARRLAPLSLDEAIGGAPARAEAVVRRILREPAVIVKLNEYSARARKLRCGAKLFGGECA